MPMFCFIRLILVDLYSSCKCLDFISYRSSFSLQKQVPMVLLQQLLKAQINHYDNRFDSCAIHCKCKFLQYQIQLMKEQVEKVKIITLKDNKNKEEKYMLMENILGKGKYGKVYKAVHVDDPNKIFAVKVIKLESPKIREECLKQLQIIRHLPKSLNLVQIHSQHLQSKNNFYLFQEYCNGGNLYQQKAARKGKPYSEDEVYNLFFQIVNGFLDLRKSNIFHEDIKPQNIMIKNNLFKLTDFGISQLSDKFQISEIRRGTLNYMPPQKLKGASFVPTSKTQIYSLGVTLFQVIFGYHPYLKKKPQDYKQYLKLINQASLKSVDELKNIFTAPSLCIDKLIRIILRMIELSEAKRLSLQELKDYIQCTEPFKSMKISEAEPVAKRKYEKSKIYEEIGHSKVIVKSQNGMGDLLKYNQVNKKEKATTLISLYKVCRQLFTDASSFIQQGVFYSKDTKIHGLKKIQVESKLGLKKVMKVTQIQFMSLLFIERMFSEFEKVINNFIFQCEFEIEEQSGLLNVGEDKQFISNQFLNFYMELDSEDKKNALNSLKQKGTSLADSICSELQEIFSNISCVRINFKQDMLAVLFIKYAPSVFRLIKVLLDELILDSSDSLMNVFAGQPYATVKQRLLKFSAIQSGKKEKIRLEFESEMKGHEILEDDQSNSDQFQVLNLDDFQ